MTPLKSATFRLDEALLEGLQQVKDRDGVPVSEQVRRAVIAWLESRGISKEKAGRKRAQTRKRP